MLQFCCSFDKKSNKKGKESIDYILVAIIIACVRRVRLPSSISMWIVDLFEKSGIDANQGHFRAERAGMDDHKIARVEQIIHAPVCSTKQF